MKWQLPLLADLLLIILTGMGILVFDMPSFGWIVLLLAWAGMWRLERWYPSRPGMRLLMAGSVLVCLSARYAPWSNRLIVSGLALALLSAGIRQAIFGVQKQIPLPWLEKPFYVAGVLLWISGAYANDSAQALIFCFPAFLLAARSIWQRHSSGKPLWQHHMHTDIQINAPRAAVWAVLTDNARYGEWNPFVQSLEGELAVGQRLRAKIGLGHKAMTFHPRVLAFEENAELRWVGHFVIPGLFDGEHYFHLIPKDGGTHFVHGERFSGLLAPLLDIYEQTLHGFKAMNAALKKRVEER